MNFIGIVISVLTLFIIITSTFLDRAVHTHKSHVAYERFLDYTHKHHRKRALRAYHKDEKKIQLKEKEEKTSSNAVKAQLSEEKAKQLLREILDRIYQKPLQEQGDSLPSYRLVEQLFHILPKKSSYAIKASSSLKGHRLKELIFEDKELYPIFYKLVQGKETAFGEEHYPSLTRFIGITSSGQLYFRRVKEIELLLDRASHKAL